ncbi:16S rRNA (cytidine(1402)-2'-O)-methyltransferase [Kamptonema cortianum]|nr:16S rRNA (cytidine(1402)-2'-O)-methyltransferase [Geitlerinema splendidum]MDK3161037.1 16S rRNA (cytidine(1402)-2'-O)-methyltransferase [Kamptonema cortianum]
MSGRLWMVAGPIGNLSEISERATVALGAAQAVIVEDSRVSGNLLKKLDISTKLIVINEHTHSSKVASLAAEIAEGGDWALLTDAGTPGISDPGAELVDAVWEAGGTVTPVSGPSAVTTALSASGFFAQRFAFLGFLPRKPGPARDVLTPFADSSLTLVLFESPHRWRKALQICGEVFGGRRVAICRELTKVHEQICRGNLDDLAFIEKIPDKGEFTLVIEGQRRRLEKP